MAKKKAKPKNEKLSFEQALEKLEIVVRELESGEMGLDEALRQYESGIGYLKHCHQALRSAESKIEMLTRIDRNGVSEGIPFDDSGEAESLSEKQSRRADRRSAGKPAGKPAGKSDGKSNGNSSNEEDADDANPPNQLF